MYTLPSKHYTSTRCLTIVDPPSTTSAQHWSQTLGRRVLFAGYSTLVCVGATIGDGGIRLLICNTGKKIILIGKTHGILRVNIAGYPSSLQQCWTSRGRRPGEV